MKWYFRWPTYAALWLGYWILIGAARQIPVTHGWFSDPGDWLAGLAALLIVTYGWIDARKQSR